MKTALSIKVGIGKAAHNQELESFCVTSLSSLLFLSPLTSHFSALAKCLHLNKIWVDSNTCLILCLSHDIIPSDIKKKKNNSAIIGIKFWIILL